MHVMICDDSALARKSLNRSICTQFDVDVVFSENGREALSYLSQNNVDILFLDLTMPVMDGFQVLQALPVSSYPTKVIVISGDIQLQAKERCLSLGAVDFIEKPYKAEQLFNLLNQLQAPLRNERLEIDDAIQPLVVSDIDPQTKFKEIANIALGSGAALVADKIGIFIELPLPTVGILEASELKMTITDALQRENLHAVSQRFVGSGFHGEALICMRGDGLELIGHSLGFTTAESHLDEIVLNIANLFISTFLNSLAEQLGVNFSLRPPVALKNHYAEKASLQNLTEGAFTVEFTYHAEHTDFSCEVLLFFDEQSVAGIHRLMETL